MNLVSARYASNVRDPDQNFILVAIDNNDAVYAAVQVNQQMIIGNDTISSTNFTGAGTVIKIDSAGNDVWAHEFTTTNLCYARCMQNIPNNSGIMLGGGFTGTTQLGSQSLISANITRPFIAINGANNQTCTAIQSGNYSVTYEYTTGCTGIDSSAIENVIVTKTSNIKNLKNITVQPNPTNGIIFIEGLNSDISKSTFQLSNMIGQLIIEGKFNHTRKRIDLSEAQTGIYFVRINDGKEISTFKIIKN